MVVIPQIPPKLLQNLNFSLRTAYATLLTLLLQYYYPWTPIFISISPIVAIICPAKWFGTWQENLIKVGYASFIGSVIGMSVSACSNNETMLLVLLFGLFFINSLPNWDRLTKVIGTLSIVTTALMPSLIKAFLSNDSIDVCCADYDQLARELLIEMDKLKIFQKYSINEALLFPHMSKFPNSLLLYIKTIENIKLDLDTLRSSVKSIIFNHSQFYFAHKLENLLISMKDEMELLLTIVGEYLISFNLMKFPVYFASTKQNNSITNNSTVSFFEAMKKERINIPVNTKEDEEKEEDLRPFFHYSFQGAYNELVIDKQRSNSTGSILFLQNLTLTEPNLTEEEYLKSYFSREYQHSLKHLLHLREQLFTEFNLVRKKYVAFSEENNKPFDPSALNETDPSIFLDKELLRNILQEENHRFSFRNFGPRCLYFHELSIVVEHFFSFATILEVPVVPQEQQQQQTKNRRKKRRRRRKKVNYYILEIINNLRDVILFYYDAVCAFFTEVVKEINKFLNVLTPFLLTRNVHHYHSLIALSQIHFSRNIQPFKVSLIVAIAAIIPLYNLIPTLLQKGVWTVYVPIFIRQDNISSSFQASYQRLEGTVIGSIYAFIIYELFPCHADFKNSICIDQIYLQTIFLIIWLILCGLFREGEQHGYSATVAGFTPFILLLTQATTGQFGTFCRIEENFIGIGIYLLIDFSLFPRRMYPLLKESILKCIQIMREVIQDNGITIEKVGKYETIKVQPPTHELVRFHHRLVSDAQLTASSEELSLSQSGADHEISLDSIDLYDFDNSPSTKVIPDDTVKKQEGEEPEGEGDGDIELGRTVMNPSHATSKPPQFLIRELGTPTNLPNEQSILIIYEECKRSIHIAEINLHSFRDELTRQLLSLKAILYEPNPFFYSFPWTTYDQLYHTFHHVYRSSYGLNTSSKSLMMVICQMMEREETIPVYLQHLSFLIQHVLIVTHKSDESLALTYEAFQKIYEQHDFTVDLKPLLTLRGNCERLLHSVDDHFRNVYLHNSTEILSNFNPYFIVALFSLFECMILLIQSLSEFGMALHMVRNVEAYQFSSE